MDVVGELKTVFTVDIGYSKYIEGCYNNFSEWSKLLFHFEFSRVAQNIEKFKNQQSTRNCSAGTPVRDLLEK